MEYSTALTIEDKPVIVADCDGTVRSVNGPFTEAFGWTMEDLAGRSLTRIIPEGLREAHQLGFSRFLATASPTLLDQPLDLEIRTANGQALLATHFIMRGEENGRIAFAAIITPR